MPVYTFGEYKPRLGKNVWIAPTAVVIGNVLLDDDVSIWFGTIIRGDMHEIRIGRGTNIQDNSVVHITKDTHPTYIGAYVTVGHRAVVHGCTVEDGCLIGIGSIILDGARIGAESIVGAAALVPPGMEVPPRSLVLGVPAKIVRKLSDDEVEKMRQNTQLYIEYKNEYARMEPFQG